MKEMKNPSPRTLAALAALAIACSTGFIFFLATNKLLFSCVLTVCLFLFCYAIIHALVTTFIFRKIKLIYKLIYQTKASKREETYYKYILPKKTIDEVKEDVEKWAARQKEDLEILKATIQFRKEFLQNLAHEFKTPVFAIQGYVDALQDGALENKELSAKFLTNTSKNVDRIVNLIKDLDAISKLETREPDLDKSNFIIQDLIKEVYEELSIKMQKLDLTTTIKKGCEGPDYVYADKLKLKQVITNIVSNACKYGQWKGNIIASVYKIDEKRLLVEISDDGIGIKETHLPRLFERFYRTDEGRSRNSGGSGLGLAICKHIIEAHHQTIHARSKEGIGTTIGFTLARRA